MKKSIKILILFSVLSAPLLKAQMTSYTELYDNPMGYRRLSVNLHIVQIELATPTNGRFGVGAEFILNKRISFSGDLDIVPASFQTVSDAVKLKGVSAEGGAVFNFRAKVKKGKIVYRWKADHSEYKFKVDGKVLKTIGVRGGVYSYSSPKDLGLYKAYFNSTGVYGGIQFGSQRYKLISAEGIRERNTSKETKGIFYIDAMFSPVIKYSDNTDYTYLDRIRTNPSHNPDLDTMVTKNYAGVRMGWQKTERYPWPFQYGWEVGMRPGLQKNVYFILKMAITIGFIHPRPKEEDVK